MTYWLNWPLISNRLSAAFSMNCLFFLGPNAFDHPPAFLARRRTDLKIYSPSSFLLSKLIKCVGSLLDSMISLEGGAALLLVVVDAFVFCILFFERVLLQIMSENIVIVEVSNR